MNIERAKGLAELAKNTVATVAIGFGGAWALYTFNGELKRENARAALEKSERELQNLKRYAIEIELSAKPLPNEGGPLQIAIQVIIHNKGAVDATLVLGQKSLRVTPLLSPGFPKQPELSRSDEAAPKPLLTTKDGEVADITGVVVPVASKNVLLYVAQVQFPGRYLVEFSVPHPLKPAVGTTSTQLIGATLIDMPGLVTNSQRATNSLKTKPTTRQ